MSTKTAMRCHYEVLNIERNAADDEIKKSYRKLALKYHPDKNPDNIEECTREFHLIQQAYDVLIDPQERAWYDKHREAILRGGLGGGDKYEDNCVDVYQYFNTSCYSGHGDDEKGFYAVFRKVFEDIAAEDLEYVEDPDNFHAPSFGDASSIYEEVVGPFYGYWESYCTSRSYVWAEKYDTREAPNRQIRRLMEQDNKKLREKARKERNEEVRALVGFVRKRDKRVQSYKKKLEERAAEVKQLAADKQKKQRQERLKEMEQYRDTGWSAATELEDDLAALEANLATEFGDPELYATNGQEAEESEEEPIDDFYCMACNKSFRTDKAFANHEKSKKHRENVAYLRAQMEEDEALQDGDNLDGEDLDSLSDVPDIAVPVENTSRTKLSKKQKKKRKQRQTDEEEDNSILEELEKLKMEQESSEPAPAGCTEAAGPASEANPGGGDDNHTEEPHQEACAESTTPAEPRVSPDPNTTASEEVENAQEDDGPSLDNSSSKTKKAAPPKNVIPQKCHVCHQSYPTRNKLFQHIKETGHALRVEAPAEETKKSKKGKKKLKR